MTESYCRGRRRFPVKLMKLQLQCPSLVWALSKALGRALNKYYLIPNFVFFFIKRAPKIL
jgi:hypothetical protein